jgi:GMP synthase-like glutamine amidotransferase
MRLLIVDNTKDLENAKMTPKLLQILDDMKIEYEVVSSRHEVWEQLERLGSDPTHFSGMVLTGGPLCLSESTYISDLSKNILIFLETSLPILGICFGYQVMAAAYGADLEKMKQKKTGWQTVTHCVHPLFRGIPENIPMFQNHHDCVRLVPFGFTRIAWDDEGVVQAIAHRSKPLYGCQFHPEASDKYGKVVIENFITLC